MPRHIQWLQAFDIGLPSDSRSDSASISGFGSSGDTLLFLLEPSAPSARTLAPSSCWFDHLRSYSLPLFAPLFRFPIKTYSVTTLMTFHLSLFSSWLIHFVPCDHDHSSRSKVSLLFVTVPLLFPLHSALSSPKFRFEIPFRFQYINPSLIPVKP